MEFELRPTNLCQLRCDHCYISSSPRKGGIIWDRVIIDRVLKFMTLLVERMYILGPYKLSVRITGGEPLLLGSEKLEYLLTGLREKFGSISLGITSNFLLYDRQVKDLVKRYNLIVYASYDPEIRFKKKEQQILWEKKIKKALDDGINLVIGITMTREVTRKRESLLEYLELLGVDKVYFAPYSSTGRGKEKANVLCPTREEIVDFVKWFLENASSIEVYPFKDMRIQYETFKKTGRGNIECWSDCWNDFGINPDLSVTSVGMCWENCYYGKIGSDIEKSVDEIFSSPARIDFQKAKLFGKSECFSCEYYDFCRGGCLSMEKHHFKKECRGLKSLMDYLIKGNKKAGGECYAYNIPQTHGQV